jgi:hypothetical protein
MPESMGEAMGHRWNSMRLDAGAELESPTVPEFSIAQSSQEEQRTLDFCHCSIQGSNGTVTWNTKFQSRTPRLMEE